MTESKLAQNLRWRDEQKTWTEYPGGEGQFVADLFEEQGVSGPRAVEGYKIAYDHGHASGYWEIRTYFIELLDLIKT